LTQRTLQRRLAEEGASFSSLLRDAREEKAREYLARGGMAMEAIAGRLGFRDAVAFSHAFKDWTGQSPGAFRRSLAEAPV
jgi:AraC-like DNA-binding protein